jgi:hypothetical protein
MPPNTVKVARPSKWGNPFTVLSNADRARVVSLFRNRMIGLIAIRAVDIDELRGKNLACWCPLEDKDGNRVPCHADVLLEISNREAR